MTVILKCRDSDSYQAIVCEQTAASFNAELKLVCTKGTLNILFANFGRNNSQICAVPHSSSGSTSQICIDTGATAIVKNRYSFIFTSCFAYL